MNWVNRVSGGLASILTTVGVMLAWMVGLLLILIRM
jgi:hypothetical protein